MQKICIYELDINANNLPDFFEKALQIYTTYQKLSKCQIGRLALVATKFCKTPHPRQTLAQYFCKQTLIDNPLKRAEKFDLHAYKKYEFDSFHVNSWMRFRTGEYKGHEGIALEQDLNTLAEKLENTDYIMDRVKQFHDQGQKEHDMILKKYFFE